MIPYHRRIVVPYPPQMPVAPPPKHGMSGCAIAAIVVGIVALVGTCATGVGVYMLATSKIGRTTFKLVSEGTQLAQKGLTAPGTPEIRALGCEQAMVLDMKDWSALMSDVLDAGADAGIEGLVISCQVRAHAPAPTCDDVASTYVRAVGSASADFVVTVQRQGDHDPLCQSSYDKSGALVSSGSAGGI